MHIFAYTPEATKQNRYSKGFMINTILSCPVTLIGIAANQIFFANKKTFG